MRRPFWVGLLIVSLAMPLSAASKSKTKSAGGFWADAGDDFYHQSGCKRARRPGAEQMISGSEKELIALGYFPHHVCLPNRLMAERSGRVVRVEGTEGIIFRTEPRGGPTATTTEALPLPPSGFPSLAPTEPKPGEVNPFGSLTGGESKPEPIKPAATTGGFPVLPSQTGKPADKTDKPIERRPGSKKEGGESKPDKKK